MKYFVGDASLKEDIRADCDAGFGPALYLMGLYSRMQCRKDEEISYFRAGAQRVPYTIEGCFVEIIQLPSTRRDSDSRILISVPVVCYRSTQSH
jgi:hypothetical protein